MDKITAYDDLSRLEQLPAGWDGYEAEVVDRGALMTARRVLRPLLAYAPVPAIVPNVNGTVSFEWETDLGYAHLELSSREYSLLVSGNGFESTAIKSILPVDIGRVGGIIREKVFGSAAGAARKHVA